MITIHAGKLGCGKSYSATAEIWKLIHKGKNCYANWKIDFTKFFERKWKNPWYRLWHPLRTIGKVYYWETMDDLYKLANGEVFFDEAHMSIDARDFFKLPKEFKRKLTQSRKYGLNLHFITQHSQQIDVAVRRLANDYVLHKKFWRLFTWKEWDGEHIETLANATIESKPRSQGFGFYWFSKRFAKSYDTFALFKPFEKYQSEPMWDAQKIVADRKEAQSKDRTAAAVEITVPLKNRQKINFLPLKGGDINVFNLHRERKVQGQGQSLYGGDSIVRRLT